MGRKISVILGLAAAGFFLGMPLFNKQPFSGADFMVLLKIFALLIGAAGVWFFAEQRGAGEKPAFGLPGITRILCVLVSGLIALNYGFELYRVNLIWKALSFFTAGLILAFMSVYMADRTGRQFAMAAPIYRAASFKSVFIKLSIALGLSLVEVYFVKTNHVVIASIAFVFMISQLLLVFKFTGLAPDTAQEAAKANAPALPEKIFSVLMIAASFYLYYLAYIYMQVYDVKTAMLSFILGSFLFGLAPAGSGYAVKQPEKGESGVFDAVFCLFIFILGLLVFSWKLMDIPPGIHGDENMTVLMAQRLERGEFLRVILESPQYNGMATIYYLMIALLGKIFGTHIVTARWFSIVFAAGGLVFVYLLVKDIFNRRAAVLSSLLLSSFFMYVFYSRNALQWVIVPSVAAAAFYFFFKGLKRGNPLYFIASGILLAFDLCQYSAGKVAPFIVASFLAVMLIRGETRGPVLKNWKGILLMMAALVLAFSPVIDYMIAYPDRYFERMKGLKIVQGIPSSVLEYQALVGNMVKNVQMFITESANGYCHNIPNKPFLDGFASFALIAGLGFLFFTWKREASPFMILWLLFGLLPGFLSRLGPEDPYPARTVMAIPAVIIIISLGVERSLAKIESLWPKFLKIATPLLIAYFAVWFMFNNLRDYFVVFNNDPHTQTYYKMAENIVAKRVIKEKKKIFYLTVRMGTSFYFGITPGLDMHRIKLFNPADFSLSRLYSANTDMAVVAEGIYYKTMPIYKEYFPDARVDTIWDRNFWMLDKTSDLKYCYGWKYPDKTIDLNDYMQWFYFYDARVNFVLLSMADIPLKSISEKFTLKADFFREGALRETADIYAGIMASKNRFDRAVISGLVEIPDYGNYAFRLDGAAGRVSIDGRPAEGGLTLYKGLHRIKAEVNGGQALSADIKWKVPGDIEFRKINPMFFINSDKVYGLVGSYSRDGKKIYEMLEPAIDYRLYYDAHLPPYQDPSRPYCDITWDGYVNIASAGEYEFKLDTLYNARITLDGETVYTKESEVDQKAPKEFVKKLRLEKGKKKVRITTYYRYISTLWSPGSWLRFMYRVPGHAEFGPVTYDMLSPVK